jgi:hypothetical protein
MAAINHPIPQPRRIPLPVRHGSINWWVLGAMLVFGIGATLPVLQNSTATSRGFEVQALQAQENQLNGDIKQIESDVAQLTSLQRIQRRAEALGLVPGVDPIYIEVTEAGPAPAKIPSEYLPEPVHQADEPDSWWKSLFGWLSLGN